MYEAAFSPEPYHNASNSCAIAAITPESDAFMHTYYDVCPWSPSGRYVVCLRLPFEERRPKPGDEAEVCVIDLEKRMIRGLYKTTAWGFQTGAHQMWGNDDNTLYSNDRRDSHAVGVRYHIDSGNADIFEGPIWQVAPDERMAVSPCLNRANLTQPEYGIAVSEQEQEFNTQQASETDGLFVVDMESGAQRLLLSLAQVWEALPDHSGIEDTVLYGFHAKINPQGTHLMFVVRARKPDGSYVPMLVTSRTDGSDLRVTVPHHVWQQGGHHPSWHPTGEQILMNLVRPGLGMRFCLIGLDGKIEVILPDLEGTGHPILSPEAQRMVTDLTDDSGANRQVTVRLIDVKAGSHHDILRVASPLATGTNAPLRRDAHTTWNRTGNLLLFGAAPAGSRRLFVADPNRPAGAIPQLT